MDEVPRPEKALLAFDEQEAVAGEDEEVLLGVLAVVHAVRLTRPEDPDAEAEFLEAVIGVLEAAVAAEDGVFVPAGSARVDDEATTTFGDKTRVAFGQLCLGDHPFSFLAVRASIYGAERVLGRPFARDPVRRRRCRLGR